MRTTRWADLFSLGTLALLLLGLVEASRAHPAFVTAHPFNLVWIGLATALATATLLLHRAGVPPRTVVPFLGFGVIACLLALLVQGVAHPTIASALGPGPPGIAESLLLGFTDAAFQTAAKWGVVAWLLWRRRASAPREVLAIGLAIGLGFAYAELATKGQRSIVAETAIAPPALLSLWECACSSGFHVYSGALIAVAVAGRWITWVEAALVLHTALAGLATPYRGGGSAPDDGLAPALTTAIAVATWLLYLRAKEELKTELTLDADPPRMKRASPGA